MIPPICCYRRQSISAGASLKKTLLVAQPNTAGYLPQSVDEAPIRPKVVVLRVLKVFGWNLLMRFYDFAIAASIGLTIIACPQLAAAQDNRDFVFTDEEGHLVLRYAGTDAGALDQDQIDEIVNAEFSSMVHDRLRADLRFDAEPMDREWADAMAPRIKTIVSTTDVEFAAIIVECRSASCRLLLEESSRLSITDHQAVLEAVQLSLQAFIKADPASFDPVFLIAAYDQNFKTPSIKAYLQRATP